MKFCLCWRSSGAEQLPCKQWVGGSNPPASAMAARGAAARRAEPCFRDSRGSHRVPADSGRYPSGQRGQTVNLLVYAFGGSNPPLPTIIVETRTVPAGPGRFRALGVWGPFRGPHVEDRGNSSAVERQPSKLGVAGSNPVSRSRSFGGHRGAPRVARGATSVGGLGAMSGPPIGKIAHVAQSVERVLGKDEVSGSIPDMGSTSTVVGIVTANGRK